ncbi:P-loop NTPase fold protein [Turicibacter sp. KK003]|uniref:P-loop NTPase fold protein n=1 Tax=Turicibacter sp. KK003 TaxID=3114695 RepID=UPI0030CF8618
MDQLKTLSAEEITDVVKRFLDNQLYNSALLIDGKWGTGKTYFLKTTLIPKIKEHGPKRPLYVSLNGINSIEEIKNQITVSFITEMASGGGDKKVLRKGVTQSGIQKLGGFLRVGKSLLKKYIDIDGIKINIADYLDFSKFVLIFDDLERCACPVNEVMGYLNNFVEHQGAKVILIANETEICGGNDKKERDKYEKIKEKLVGHTIRYNPSLIDIYENLIETHVHDENLKQLLKEHIGSDIDYALKLEHPNIRTYLFYLEKIMGLYNNLGDYKDNMALFSKIRLYTYVICIKYKLGIYSGDWEEGELYKNIPLIENDMTGPRILGFSMIDRYILEGSLNKDRLESGMELYLKEQEDEGNPLTLLADWYTYTEVEVNEALNKVLDKLVNNEYTVTQYQSLANSIIDLYNAGFEGVHIDRVYNQIKKNIESFPLSILNDLNFKRLGHRYYGSRALSLVKGLNEKVNEVIYADRKVKLEQCLRESGWGEKLYDMVQETTVPLEERIFMKGINIEDLYQAILNASNKDLAYLRYSIYDFYRYNNINQYYKDDIPSITKLIDKLKNTDENKCDAVKKINIKLLLEILEDKLELLKK